ncbi:MAG: OadG family protein [Bilifractor sp.]|jgi:sodium pump decarboxylase gamma subunit
MKIIKKQSKALLVLALSLIMLFSGAVTVFAAESLSDDMKTAIASYAASTIDQLYTADEETLDAIREQGDFAQVAVDAVRDNQETLGAYQKVGDTTVDDSGDQIVSQTKVEFSNYNATIEIYYDYEDDQPVPVNFVVNPDFPLSIKMEQAGSNMLVGLILVFVVLIFLAFVISLFKYVGKGKTKEEEPVKRAAPSPAPAAPAPEKQAVPASGKEEEIAAAIAAAIAMAEEEQPSGGNGYYVRSIHSHTAGRKWKRA